MRKVFLSLIILLFSFEAKADIYTYAFQVECLPEIGAVSLKMRRYGGADLADSFHKNSKQMAEKYGIIYVHSLFDTDEEGNITKINSYEKKCKIGDSDFEVKITPYSANLMNVKDYYNFYSIIARISNNGKLLIDGLLFEKASSDEEYVDEIIATAYPSYYGVAVNGSKNHYQSYDNDKFVPVTNQLYYSSYWQKIGR